MVDNTRRKRPRRHIGKLAKREFAVLAGFAPASMVMTDDGEVPVEWLSEGDQILTRDAGYKPVLKIEHSRLGASTLRDLPELAPIKLEAGSLDGNKPERDILLSPSQLIHFDRIENAPEEGGVLITADIFAQNEENNAVRKLNKAKYVSILLDGHHLIQVEGAWVGSLYLADLAVDANATDPMLEGLSSPIMTPAAPILARADATAYLNNRPTRIEKKRA